MRIVIGVIAVTWLFIGGVAADQRGDFAYGSMSCASVSEISLTLAAGPLNYQGLDPEIACTMPSLSV